MLDLFTVIDSHIQNYDSQLFTAMPASVLEVTKDGGIKYVKVQPSLNKIYTDGVTSKMPPVSKVPVVFPSGGGGLLSFPIVEGDTVLLIFSKRNISNWLEGDGGEVNPATLRTNSLNDAIAIPGLYPTKNNLSPNDTDTELKYNGNTILLKQDGGMEIKTESGDLDVSASGKVAVTTGSTLSVRNSSEELISLLSELIDACSAITTSTVYSAVQPTNNASAFTALKARLDTFKE